MILLDTHTLIWLDEGSDRLGTKSREAIDTALENNELFVATISFWEAAMLIEKGRLTMQTGLDEWRRSLINYGLQELPLTGEIAISSARLPNFHGDPADRIIVATARLTNVQLHTADDKILGWQHDLLRFDARQ